MLSNGPIRLSSPACGINHNDDRTDGEATDGQNIRNKRPWEIRSMEIARAASQTRNARGVIDVNSGSIDGAGFRFSRCIRCGFNSCRMDAQPAMEATVATISSRHHRDIGFILDTFSPDIRRRCFFLRFKSWRQQEQLVRVPRPPMCDSMDSRRTGSSCLSPLRWRSGGHNGLRQHRLLRGRLTTRTDGSDRSFPYR